MDRIGKVIRKLPAPDINRITFFTTFNYALRNYYSDDINHIPPPITGNEFNCYISFITKEPGIVTVDWGDGSVETFKLRHSSGGYYVAPWRSLNFEYFKNPDTTNNGWGWGKDVETGEVIIPYPNHHYMDDDKTIERKIVMTFSSVVYNVRFATTKHTQFPILETSQLELLDIANSRYIQEIPYNRISKLKNLTSLALVALGNVLQYIPDSLFDMIKLNTLNLVDIFNLTNVDASNIRKISKLKNLRDVNLSRCYMPTYIKEFNDLPLLKSLNLAPNYKPDEMPTFDEVDKINPNLTSLNYMGDGWINGRNRLTWNEFVAGKGLENIGTLNIAYNKMLPWVFPDYIKNEMRSMSLIYAIECTPTLERIDSFVNNLYEYIMDWDLITMGSLAQDGNRNQFYGLRVDTYNPSTPTESTRPSGIEQAPTGFILGVSNGNPQTPMEKIYVLKNNYKQAWNVNPVA